MLLLFLEYCTVCVNLAAVYATAAQTVEFVDR